MKTHEEKIVIMKILAEKSIMIDQVLAKYVPRSYSKENLIWTLGKPRYTYSPEATNEAIAKPIWDFLDRGGKRWRPVLLLMVLEALGGNTKKYLDFVAIPELVHNGTIMVDDLEDDSELRRGKLCTHKLFGIDIAINAGNAMYYLPLLVLMRNKNKINQRTALRIYEIYAQEMINISFGQGMDIAWHRGLAGADEISEQEYLQMCAYKTGTLARMAAKIGAILAEASDDIVEKIGKLAESIGVAFQIQDDILNLVGEEFQKGKGVGEDIHEGKRTLMIIHTIRNANELDRKRLIEILNMHTNDQKLITEAIEILKKYGSIDYAKSYARKIVQDSWKEVDKIIPENRAKLELKAFAQFLIEREY